MPEPENDRRKRREKPALLSLAGGDVREPADMAAPADFSAAGWRGADSAARHRHARLAREARKPDPLLTRLAAAGAGEVSDDGWPEPNRPDRSAAADTPGQRREKAGRGDDPFGDGLRRPIRDDLAADADLFRPLVDPALLAGRVWNWRYRIMGLTLAGLVLGSAVALSIPHRYTAYAQILVDPRELKLVGRDIAPDFLANEAALAIVDSQLELVHSPAVLGDVVKNANLEQDPEFNGQGESLGGVLQTLRGIVTLFSGSGETDSRTRLAMRNLRENVWAERSDRTFIINIGVTTRNPDKSALVANELTRAFIAEQERLQSDSARDASSALGSRLDTLRENVERAEATLESYKAENGLIGPEGRLVTDDQLAAVTVQLAQARAETIAAKSRAEAAKSADPASVAAGGLPQDLTSTTLTALRAQHGTLLQQLAALENALGPRHPKLADARASLQSVEAEIAAEVRRIVAGTQADLRRAVENEQALAASLAQLKAESVGNNDAQIRLRELQRNLAAAREIYEAVLLRARETGELEELKTTNSTVIAPAEPPESPSSLSRKIIAAGFGAGGFLLGLGLAFLSALRDSLFRGPDGRGRAASGPVPSAKRGGEHRRSPPDPKPAAATLVGNRRSAPRDHRQNDAVEGLSRPHQGREMVYPYLPYNPYSGQPAVWPYAAPPFSPMQAIAGFPTSFADPAQPQAPWPGMVPGYPYAAVPPEQAVQPAPPPATAPTAQPQPPVRSADNEEMDGLRQSVREIRETLEALMRRRAARGRRIA